MSSNQTKEISIGNEKEVHESVKHYYGKQLQSAADLQTSACTSCERPPPHLRALYEMIHDEVASHFYGCGLVSPPLLEGTAVLDLGSGSGRDCFVLSGLVGERGRVVGVDMTPEQVELAQKYIPYHAEKLGFSKPNVQFKLGSIERLADAGVEADQIDVAVSNCVVNLCPDKLQVLREVYRALKSGGELYFSDVYASRRFPEHLKRDPVLWGECVSGALYWNDFLHLAKLAGFLDPRLVTRRPLELHNAALAEKLEGIEVFSATYRLFKIEDLDSQCEDYGQAVIYLGSIPNEPKRFVLDATHVFETGRVVSVCRNTFLMLARSRFAPHFQLIGEKNEVHFGPFACGAPASASNSTSSSSCCS